jgi:pyridoxal phosphate enzyme (YggS family)
LADIRERVEHATRSANRADSVTIVAVSKAQPPDAVAAAYRAGQRDFGESYVQELLRKADELSDLDDLRWHLVGHLQRNKVRSAVGRVSAVHSVGSERLALALGARAAEGPVPLSRRWLEGERLPVFVEVNLAAETHRAGCAVESLSDVIAAVESQPSLRLIGLMTIAPAGVDLERAREHFEQLLAQREVHGCKAALPELSVGMSHDLEVAVA